MESEETGVLTDREGLGGGGGGVVTNSGPASINPPTTAISHSSHFFCFPYPPSWTPWIFWEHVDVLIALITFECLCCSASGATMSATSTSFHFHCFLFSQLFRWLMGCWSSASGAPLVSNLAISPPPLGSVWYNPLKVKKKWSFNCSDIIIIFNMSLERFQKDIPQNDANYNTLTTRNTHITLTSLAFHLFCWRSGSISIWGAHLNLFARHKNQPHIVSEHYSVPTKRCFEYSI